MLLLFLIIYFRRNCVYYFKQARDWKYMVNFDT